MNINSQAIKMVELRISYNLNDRELSIAFQLPKKVVHRVLRNRGLKNK